ncbi:MAG: dCTP deaminase [Blastocatellia bacterium]|nr:dCTP deaminase [Blastocatellia bacterium]MBL8196318.1 dCTP deaminase [Blastocatellia bacterium]MBN8724069.1 dCTP deaminase [Acidobacteriota bacterium]
MAIKSDKWIKHMCETAELITPFETSLLRQVDNRRIISCGLSSYGYDCRLARDEFKVFSPIQGTEINPKQFDSKSLLDIPLRTDADGSTYWLLPPHSYALGITIERFNIPRNVTAIALGKSTYARCGIVVNTTPLEANWRGRLVIELYNAANLPVRLFAEEGFVQILFFQSDEECETSYSDRQGKYQDQSGLTLAKV